MSNANYNPSEIEDLITQSGKIAENIELINQEVDKAYNDIDGRVSRKFAALFGKINRTNNALKNELSDIDSYNNWLRSTLQDFSSTDSATQGIASDAEVNDLDFGLEESETGSGDAGASAIAALTAGIDSVIGGQGSAGMREEFHLDPEKWSELPADVKEAIEAKLKELGFTDEEIKKIKDGETGVDKVVLESLSDQLEKALKADPSIRQLLLEKYGFDIFNDDGTVNKDLLAIAMMIDGKNPDDAYDLQSFLNELNKKKLEMTSATTGKLPGGNSNVAKADISQIHNDDSLGGNKQNIAATSIHSGSGYSGKNANGIASAEGASTSLLDAMTGKDGKDNIEDALSNAATSIAGGRFKPTGNISDIKKGGVGVGSAIAGIGAAAGAAGIGGVLVKKKKEKEDEDEESSYDDDDFFNQTGDSSNGDSKDASDDKEWLTGVGLGIASIAGVGATAATTDALSKEKEEHGKENTNKDKQDNFSQNPDDENFKPSKIKPGDADDDKSWLLGLGVGLAAAGTAGKIAKDKLDEKENEEEEEL